MGETDKKMITKDTILFTSMCYSEDRNANLIGFELRKLTGEGFHYKGASYISEGEAYRKNGIDLVFSSHSLKTGGFVTESPKAFLTELFSGSVGIPLRFVKAIKPLQERLRFVLVVGDVYFVWLVRRAFKNVPIAFYVHSKSRYIEPHYKIEEWYLRKATDIVIGRDEVTAEYFRSKNIDAVSFGNVIMDNLHSEGVEIERKPSLPTIGILPGTRAEAYENFFLILESLLPLADKQPINVIAAVVDSLSDEKLSDYGKNRGWKLEKGNQQNYLVKGYIRAGLVRRAFVDTVQASDVIVGLSGAGNEQAAGLGKPVISFVGSGHQTSKRRLEEQSRLMGDSLWYLKEGAEGVPHAVMRLLQDKQEYERRVAIGRERMGKPGAAQRIAEFLYERYLKD